MEKYRPLGYSRPRGDRFVGNDPRYGGENEGCFCDINGVLRADLQPHLAFPFLSSLPLDLPLSLTLRSGTEAESLVLAGVIQSLKFSFLFPSLIPPVCLPTSPPPFRLPCPGLTTAVAPPAVHYLHPLNSGGIPHNFRPIKTDRSLHPRSNRTAVPGAWLVLA